jgi:hydrogenase maturation protease
LFSMNGSQGPDSTCRSHSRTGDRIARRLARDGDVPATVFKPQPKACSPACHKNVAGFSPSSWPFCCVTEYVKTLILCLGDEKVRDDGIAAVAGRLLQSLPLPSNVAVKVAASVSFDLLDEIATSDQLVLVDALASGGEVGTCTVVDVSDLASHMAASECAHCATVSQILEFARYLAGGDNPYGVAIAGVEGGQFMSYGTSFSDPVWAAVPRLVDLILLFVGAGIEARTMVKESCRRMGLRAEQPACIAPADYRWMDRVAV